MVAPLALIEAEGMGLTVTAMVLDDLLHKPDVTITLKLPGRSAV